MVRVSLLASKVIEADWLSGYRIGRCLPLIRTVLVSDDFKEETTISGFEKVEGSINDDFRIAVRQSSA